MKRNYKINLYLVLFALSPIWIGIVLAILFQEMIALMLVMFWPVTIFMSLMISYKKPTDSPDEKKGMSKGFKIALILVVFTFIILMIINTFFGLTW